MTYQKDNKLFPKSDSSCFQPFISPNPITLYNPVERYPDIDKTAFIGPFTSVIGDVEIKENVYVAPNVSMRADEGTPFYIGTNTNLQDGVILHGIAKRYVSVKDKKYSIYIENEVSVAHSALIHGPCFIGNNTFVGYHSIVYNAIVGPDVFISHNAVVTNGVRVPPKRFVPPGAHIDTQEKADALFLVAEAKEEFAKTVQSINQQFPPSYHILFGEHRCSCGMPYNR
ncbi:carbonate dehydratase [Bacillus sp. 165]|uniref:carbonate dehydratase n=1 Tax=Bacillus sp. 165 TaxID=1529117 RepID=UPI001FFE0C4A|nr:carbonate dehydratase [Bacillus sp. 165]